MVKCKIAILIMGKKFVDVKKFVQIDKTAFKKIIRNPSKFLDSYSSILLFLGVVDEESVILFC